MPAKTTQTLAGRTALAAPLLIAGTVGMLALPSAVLAFGSQIAPGPAPGKQGINDEFFMPVAVDPRLARSIAVRALAKGRTFQFTPAGQGTRPDRSVTVAVRIDAAAARSTRISPRLAATELAEPSAALRIAPTAYNLGSSRGYRNFAQSSPMALAAAGSQVEIPDLTSLRPPVGARGAPSRFSPRIALDEHANPGRSARTFDADGEQSVDVGGSYRLSRNLNVTAGVRIQTERDRLVPLTDGKQDSQAVYVGTQFRF
jgi:hypothetical protein